MTDTYYGALCPALRHWPPCTPRLGHVSAGGVGAEASGGSCGKRPAAATVWSLAVTGRDGKLEEPIGAGCAVQNELLGGPKAG